MEPEKWDFFDLDQEIHVAISEDGKEYLKQFGLEEYNFENFDPCCGAGKYYDDTPLDENPEAVFDVLSREAHKCHSSRGDRSTAPPRPSPRKSAQKEKPRSKDPLTGLTTDSAAIEQRHKTADDTQPQSSPAKTPPKKVSFSDRPSRDGGPSSELPTTSGKPAKVSRSAASFFGRPKTKSPDKKGKSRSVAESSAGQTGLRSSADRLQDGKGRPGNSTCNAARNHTEDTQQETGNKNRGPSSPKKTRKFKFPGIELVLRSRGKTSNSETNSSPGEPLVESQSENGRSDSKQPAQIRTENGRSDSIPPSQIRTENGRSDSIPPSQIRTQGNTPSRYPHSGNKNSNRVCTLGVEELDLVKHSPELGAMKASAQQPKHISNRVSESDSDNTTQSPRVEGRPPVINYAMNTFQTYAARQEGDMKLVEIVSTDPTEVTSEGAGITDDMILGMEANLPAPLLAAVTGDTQLMRKAISELSKEELLSSRDGRGNTVLHVSAAGGYLPCVELLCAFCPQLLNAENKAHLTPAPMAIKHGQIEVLDWMLENIDLRRELKPGSSKRRSLLHHAARFGQDGCLRLLLTKVERTVYLTPCMDHYGNTPAHMAAKYGHLCCLQSLVEFGLDVCSPNHQGHTPCYYADFGNHRHSAGYLVVVETCAQLALEHVTETVKHERLQYSADTSKHFIKEALDLCSVISRQSAEQVEARRRLQQTLDDSLDVLSDMTGLLNALYRHNSDLRGNVDVPRQSPTPTSEDIQLSIERAADIQRHLEALENTINANASRQHLMKVKDLQRRWTAACEGKEFPHLDPAPKAKHTMKQRLSGAIQRLLVYRATMRDSQMVSHQDTASHEEEVFPEFLNKASPEKGEPVASNVTSYATQSADEKRMEPKDARAPPSPPSPRYHNNEIIAGKNKGRKQRNNWFEEDEDSNVSLTSEEESRHSVPRSRPTKGAFSRPNESLEASRIMSKKAVKNNVVESFLNTRHFYQQEPDNKSKQVTPPEPPVGSTVGEKNKIASKLWFFENDTLNDVEKSKEGTNSALRMSAFSAFNRVSTNRTEEEGDVMGVTFTDTRPKQHLPKSSEISQSKGDVRVLRQRNNAQERDATGFVRKPADQEPFNEKDGDVKTLGSCESYGTGSIMPASIDKVDHASGIPKLSAERRGTTATNNSASYESNTASTFIENPSGRFTGSHDGENSLNEKKNKVQTIGHKFTSNHIESNTAEHPQEPEIDLFHVHDPAQSAPNNCDITEGIHSDVDLGAELEADDLMLGSGSYEEDSEDDAQDYNHEVFAAEDLLSLAANGRLPLSMQFETSLSTIEEVSVVSENTRTDCETNSLMLDGSVDLEQTTDSDDTMTGASEHASNQPDTPDLKGSENTEVSEDIDGHTGRPMQDPGGEGEKPWYEMSDEDEVVTRSSSIATTRGRQEHFTLF